MGKMTKEQTNKFNKLWEETLDWGDGDNCIGLFREFGSNLEPLATCTDEGNIEILAFNGSYYDEITSAPITKARSLMKKVVTHLMDNDFGTLNDIL